MLRVRTVFSGIQGTPYLSTMYFGNTATLTNAQNANTAVGTFWGAVDNNWASTLTWSTNGVVEELDLAGNILQAFGVTPVSGAGSTTGGTEATLLNAVMQWRTGAYAGGREIRGRTFIPCHLTQNNNNGVPATAFRNALNTAAAALVADANADLVVWSKTKALTATVTSAACWTQWGSLRSRRD